MQQMTPLLTKRNRLDNGRRWLGTLALASAVTAGLAFAPVIPRAEAQQPAPAAATQTALTSEDATSLRYMREEEKLARDVYQTLGARWNMPIFRNISRAEHVHIDSIATLLTRYDIPDPAAGNAVGVFTDPSLQQLYDELVERGSRSLQDALSVGVQIEETDIADLTERIAATREADVRAVYERLLSASEQHLRAFNTQLARTGV